MKALDQINTKVKSSESIIASITDLAPHIKMTKFDVEEFVGEDDAVAATAVETVATRIAVATRNPVVAGKIAANLNGLRRELVKTRETEREIVATYIAARRA